MIHRAVDDEDPDRFYTVTRGRSRAAAADLDLVTLIVSEAEPAPGMQSEYVKVLRTCQFPTAVVEVASELGLPVSVTRILLADLLAAGKISARHPSAVFRSGSALPDSEFLKKVLVGLKNL
ncbi:MAG TPA: DUF742 domain-containing protein [Amycolatopsis sp.]|uniref:DUF742 domain-containing protein n=1 Tax=Amycolatopsis sp. TaxID=37632 RepID=UPI002B482704|nr:DUF742 domain-containing protein [Amycolatopsis sp.]HKS44169.1 DUF742 domain-containing protein [Amycolatopsis sp.]